MFQFKELFKVVKDNNTPAARALLKENSGLIFLTDSNDNSVMHKCATHGSYEIDGNANF